MASIYVALEGLLLGALSFLADSRTPGVVMQATVATFAVLAAIAVTYLLSFVLAGGGVAVPILHPGGGLGLSVSVLIIGVVALNLVLDFAFIDRAVSEGAERPVRVVRGLRTDGDTRLALRGDPPLHPRNRRRRR